MPGRGRPGAPCPCWRTVPTRRAPRAGPPVAAPSRSGSAPPTALVDPGRDTAAAARAGADPGDEPTDEPTSKAKVRAPQPDLRSRKDWGADESWRDGKPVLCRTIQQVHVHHTASGNDYSRRDVPALIRSFYRYHTRSLGWSDIGYNFLVDRFGRTWVGRAGGPSRPIRGAHTLGFNHTSVGVAVIGNYESAAAVDRIVTAIVRLAAWKLDRYDRKPRGKTRVYSHGSDKYPKGWVRLKVIDGHRDTNDTACPGDRLYARLPEIRKRTHWHVKRWS
ncbi:N-acetylmuramoyl-L-alanine amidase [Nocardioides sp. REDSEA-S30_B4]|uniref:N-acetylmuramoyl-L-alanine amidase n=1 Tax=Nocardioides sp. REDSEA-S30_B4 TaxID=1811552 RepID=UPI000AF6C34F|nr:N-acetylmuramoyl-L-alanine amidase [Nocardioides sp. REDSEA-S30_B4]